jgi:HEPN domain-containing protein
MSDQPLESEPTPAQRWFRLAEQDLAAADVLLRDGSAALRIVGFLSQQAAEKALKAGLLALGAVAPRIHDLRQLNADHLSHQAVVTDLDPHVRDTPSEPS